VRCNDAEREMASVLSTPAPRRSPPPAPTSYRAGAKRALDNRLLAQILANQDAGSQQRFGNKSSVCYKDSACLFV